MYSPLTEAREHVRDTLTASGFNVYPYPPDAPKLPAAWIQPADPWAEPVTLTRTNVHLLVKMAGTTDARTRDALVNLEERSWQVVDSLAAKGCRVTDLRAPETLTLGTLTLSVVEVGCSVMCDDEGET